MRAQSNATKSTSTATENEAKDLLRKVRFDGKNFSTFKAKFEGVCRLRHIWGIISGTETLDDSATQQQLAEFSDKANLAKSYLQTSLSDEVFDMVREDKTPAEMWQTLIDNYEKKEWSNTIYVLLRLCELKYDPKNVMLKHITKTRAIIRDLNDMGKKISESETVEWILVTLPNDGPDNFNAFINHLKPTPNQEIGLMTLISALLNEEEKRKERKRSRSYHHSRERDHKKPKENGSSYANITHEINALKTKLSTIKNVRKSDGKWCFICRKTSDHVAQDHDDFDPNFRDKKGKGARPKDYRTSKASFTKTPLRNPLAGSNDDEVNYKINAVSDGTPNGQETHWTLDNCATGHVTGLRHYVVDCDGNANLILPNGQQIKGCSGTAHVQLMDGKRSSTLTLDNVAFEPNIYKNLISHIQLLTMGYRLVKQDLEEAIYVRKDEPRTLVFKHLNGMYVLQQTKSNQVNAVKTDDKLVRWHNKLNHAGFDQVAKIIKPIMNHDEDSTTSQHKCEGCMQGQAKRVSYRNQNHFVAPKPLESLSADLCGRSRLRQFIGKSTPASLPTTRRDSSSPACSSPRMKPFYTLMS
ncbi:hypothetical protein AeMF1_013503 [Aphanomyces euteiches]|nr:hypothetical protein AeMF1_013503 [Aphanomyces euteiches]